MSMVGEVSAQRVTAFWMQVERKGPDECWPWLGYEEGGYGKVFIKGRMVGAHELAVSFTTGESRLPELDTCHSCDNPICCNPNHLRFDTRQSNVDDMMAAGRHSHPPAKLSEDDIRIIRDRITAGARQQDLADQYGVSNSLISMIKTGKRRAA